MDQLTFDDIPKTDLVFSDISPNIVDDFLTFHKQNPYIYELFKKFSYEVKNAGLSHYGAAAIFERIRWHETVESKKSDFKANNNYRSCYARLLAFEDPNFKDFFETRSSFKGELQNAA